MKQSSHYRALGRRALKAAFFASPFAPQIEQPDTFRVVYLLTGEPAIYGVPCRVSIAHTQGWGMGAVSGHTVGVDIERVRRRAHEKELLRYIAIPEERALTKRAVEQTAHIITMLWVVKEAVRKCLGITRPLSPKELVAEYREEEIFFVRWQKDYSLYKVYVKKYGGVYSAIASPACGIKNVTYCLVHDYANLHIQ